MWLLCGVISGTDGNVHSKKKIHILGKVIKNRDFPLSRKGTMALLQSSCLGTVISIEKMGYSISHARKEGRCHSHWYCCNLD